MRFRKIPVEVEAERWYPGMDIDGVQRVVTTIGTADGPIMVEAFYVRTLEGDMRVGPGDWIITGVEGEKYPCRSGIFEKTYEKA